MDQKLRQISYYKELKYQLYGAKKVYYNFE